MDVYKCLSTRRSVRRYNQKDITEKNFLYLMEAASLAPSGGNAQPWHFYIIRNQEIIQKMRKIIVESSSNPDSEFLQKFGTLFNARYVIAACINMDNRWYHGGRGPLAVSCVDDVFDNPDYVSVAAAIQNILLAAHAINVGTCWCKPSSAYRGRLEKLLNITPPYRLLANITLGHYDKMSNTPPRKPLREIYTMID